MRTAAAMFESIGNVIDFTGIVLARKQRGNMSR